MDVEVELEVDVQVAETQWVEWEGAWWAWWTWWENDWVQWGSWGGPDQDQVMEDATDPDPTLDPAELGWRGVSQSGEDSGEAWERNLRQRLL
jgi:hypothetical protein